MNLLHALEQRMLSICRDRVAKGFFKEYNNLSDSQFQRLFYYNCAVNTIGMTQMRDLEVMVHQNHQVFSDSNSRRLLSQETMKFVGPSRVNYLSNVLINHLVEFAQQQDVIHFPYRGKFNALMELTENEITVKRYDSASDPTFRG